MKTRIKLSKHYSIEPLLSSLSVEIISLNRLTDSTEINEHRSIREKRQPSFTYISIPV